MNRLRYASLLLACGMLLLLLSESSAWGYKTRKRARHRQKHMHGHSHDDHGHDHGKKKKKKDHGHAHEDHGHSHGGPWSFGGGASLSQSFGSTTAVITPGPYSLLQTGHEGHDHSGGGEGGGGETPTTDSGGTGFNPAFFGTVGYQLAEKWATQLNLGFTIDSGLFDPSVAITRSDSLIKNWTIAYSSQLSLPISEASQDSYKMTTITSAIRPSFTSGKSSLNLGVAIALSWYSKTVIVEEEAAEENLTFLLQHDHAHGPGGAHGPGIEEFGDANIGTGDREFNRYSLESSYSYRWLSNLSLTAGGSFALVTHQFGASTYESTAQLPQVDYGIGAFTISTALTLFGTGSGFTIPTTPGLTAGFLYLHE